MKNQLVFPCLVVLAFVPCGLGAGAGRAFPIAGENYVIEEFRTINPRIEWDTTNFLVDLSGNWANCQRVGQAGLESVNRYTPEGGSISALVDFTPGNAVDVNAANGYIHNVIDGWVRSGEYIDQIRLAESFGCSIRPGCSGYAVIGCLFSPGYQGDYGGDIHGGQDAQAFTREQYNLAEAITGNKWDQSYFLENLSGFETQCSMLEVPEWEFAHARQEAGKRGMRITGLFGVAMNVDGTQPAMEEILWSFKEIPGAAQVGCSVIPDCLGGRGDIESDMFVVVSCLYEEQ